MGWIYTLITKGTKMLSYKQFNVLTESTNLKTDDVHSIADFIKMHCKQFLQESKLYGKVLPIYRGIRINSEKTFTLPGHNPTRGTTGLDLETHDKLNKLFVDKFNVPFLNGVFCSGSKIQADEYGYVYGVFPIGNFEFTYNPKIYDMFYGLQYGKATPESIIDGYTNTSLSKGIDYKKEIIIFGNEILYIPEDLLQDVLDLL